MAFISRVCTIIDPSILNLHSIITITHWFIPICSHKMTECFKFVMISIITLLKISWLLFICAPNVFIYYITDETGNSMCIFSAASQLYLRRYPVMILVWLLVGVMIQLRWARCKWVLRRSRVCIMYIMHSSPHHRKNEHTIHI